MTPTATIDPIAAADRIESDYRSYLLTTFNIADPVLRSDLADALSRRDRLRRGPLLQATAPYAPGATIADLVAGDVLHRGLTACGDDVLPASRALYAHQEHALRRIAAGRNLVVATGTGSGKTECYLLPILDHLLRERDAGTLAQPGVRALLLYPMNALANDQMKRIRALFAAFPDITFGRYIGDTENQHDRAVARFRQQHGGDPPVNELVDRQSMRDRPPHVLLTNYAMLEYLLLRPDDTTFFDGPTGRHWRFVALDEMHVYDGALGAELAMLLRRVRDRVVGSQRDRVRCVGTSATLGRGAEDAEAVASCARALFDEDFDPSDVVLPERLPLADASGAWRIDIAHLAAVHDAWTSGDDEGVRSALAAARPQLATSAGWTTAPVGAALRKALVDEKHVVAFQHLLEAGSVDLHAAAEDVCADLGDHGTAAVHLVELCTAARRAPTDAPLLPARYHLFLRATEGAFVCWAPSHPTDAPRLILDRHEQCPTCANTGLTSLMFEIEVCRHCGADYLVGKKDDGVLAMAGPFEARCHLLRTDTAEPSDDVDEDETATADEEDVPAAAGCVCTGCGALGTGCGCGGGVIAVVETVHDGRDLKKCVACGRRSNTSVTLPFRSGSEAPVSVVATSLYQAIPPDPMPGPLASAGGRKLLMFADSRQDAAFFAPFLRRTHGRALERHLLWDVLRDTREPVRTEELVQPVRRLAERLGVLDEDDGQANATAVRSWALAEVLATDRRQSLDGVGLADVRPWLSAKLTRVEGLARLGLDDDETVEVLRVLLELSAAGRRGLGA